MRNVSDKSCRESQNTHFFCSATLKNCAVCEICGKILPSRAGYRHTLRTCNTYYFSTAAVVTPTCPSVTLYVHCLSYPLYVYHDLHVFCIIVSTKCTKLNCPLLAWCLFNFSDTPQIVSKWGVQPHGQDDSVNLSLLSLVNPSYWCTY